MKTLTISAVALGVGLIGCASVSMGASLAVGKHIRAVYLVLPASSTVLAVEGNCEMDNKLIKVWRRGHQCHITLGSDHKRTKYLTAAYDGRSLIVTRDTVEAPTMVKAATYPKSVEKQSRYLVGIKKLSYLTDDYPTFQIGFLRITH